jgi:tripartite-type tricarboxylate transporter receptor subunit TctC
MRLLSILLMCTALPLAAQEPFPSRPVRIVVPAAPGGGFDVFARIVGKRLSERWGQQVLVDNRAGGGGNIAASSVVRSKPDGYTLFLWNDTLLINPALMASVPYDPQRDFTPVSLALYVPNILVAHPASGIKDMSDLITRAKAAPGSLSYGSPGPGSPAHLGAELMNQLAGIELRHIPYKGAGPAITDVVAGHIPLAMIAVPGAMEHVRSGRLVPLAVTSEKRIGALPQVPTIKESGISDYRIDTFFAILGPAGMPQELVARIQADMREAVLEPAIYKQLVAQGFEPVGGSAAELAEIIRRDLPVWRALVTKSGAKSE